MKACQALLLSGVALACASCATNQPVPLLFAQSHTLGVTIGGTAQEQGVELTLGYRDRDIAVVPVSVPQAGGTNTQLNSTVPADTASDSAVATDAFSVLGQFDTTSDAKAAQVGLGTFFATGLAAQKLADGFSTKLAGGHGATPVATAPATAAPAAAAVAASAPAVAAAAAPAPVPHAPKAPPAKTPMH